MAEIVETVREIQFKEKCSSKNRYSRTMLCKRDRIIGQSGERANSRELSFICCTQKIVLIIDFNKVAYILRMDYITT